MTTRKFLIVGGVSALAGVVAIILLFRSSVPNDAKEKSAAVATVVDLECGHWAIKRCCDLLGESVTTEQIKTLMPPRSNGNSMLELTKTLTDLGLQARGIKTSYAALRTGPLPAIAHVDGSHYLVVVTADDNGVSVYDSGKSLTRISASEFQSRWKGNMVAVARPDKDAHPSGQPHAKWRSLVVDKEDTTSSKPPLVYTYEFQNVGDRDLVIEKITPDCSCLNYDMPHKPLAPGESGTVTLRYDKSGNSGDFERSAAVKTNDAVHSIAVLVAKGRSGHGDWKIEPRGIWAEKMFPGVEYSTTIVVTPPNGKQFTVLSTESDVEGMTVECQEIDRQAFGGQLVGDSRRVRFMQGQLFRLRMRPSGESKGILKGEVRLCLAGASVDKLPIPFEATVISPIKMFPETIVLGRENGQEIDEKISVVSLTGDALSIVSAKSSNSGIECSYPKEKGTTVQIRLKGKTAPQQTAAEDSVQIVVSLAGQERTLAIPVMWK